MRFGSSAVVILTVLAFLGCQTNTGTVADKKSTQGAILGGLGAALVFALTVVSVPLLVDRDVDTPTALMTSIRAVGENPVAMGWWAVFILVATGLSVITLMFGFIVLYPVMGHASWHVYRDLVDAAKLKPRDLAA